MAYFVQSHRHWDNPSGAFDVYMLDAYSHRTHMPLRPIEFHILVALASEERHGYGIMQEAARLGGAGVRLEPGTLYRALRRMLDAGWVAESAHRPAPDLDDERRRYYRLTPLGRRIAAAEAQRLARLVSAARASRLLTRA